MLKVQQYLRSGKTLLNLQQEHGVYHHIQNGKISLNYDQIEVRDNDPLSKECRGLILQENSFEIISCPFFRFFNYGQGAAVEINWDTAVFESKLDGTLIQVYFHQDQWFVSTRSRSEANVPVDDSNLTFTDLTNIAIQRQFGLSDLQDLMKDADKQKTYCFELCSPVNRIVCEYDEFSLTLLMVRDLLTLQEEDPKLHADLLGVPTIPTYNFNDINDLIAVVNEWSPKEHEGIVVKDASFNRIKVKSAQYVAYNKIRDSLSSSWRGCVEVILYGKDDDVVAMLPSFIGERIIKLKVVINELFQRTEADYQEIKDIESMKEFAFAAKKKAWEAPLFAMKRNKAANLKEFVMGKDNQVTGSMVDTILELCKKIDPELLYSKKIIIPLPNPEVKPGPSVSMDDLLENF